MGCGPWSNDVEVFGNLNSAINVGGNQGFTNNLVLAQGRLSNATNLGGNGNTVTTDPAGTGNLAANIRWQQ